MMNLPLRRRRVVPTTFAVAVGLGVFAVPDARADLPDTGSYYAHVLVVGAVLRDGQPVGGARVVAQIWPNTDRLVALKSGDRVPSMTLPAVTSDASGRFRVDLDPSLVAGGFRDREGRAQVELLISDGTNQVSWSYTAAPTATGWTSTSAKLAASDQTETALFDLGARANVSELTGEDAASFAATSSNRSDLAGRGQVSHVALMPKAPSVLPGGADVPSPTGPCFYVARGWLYNRAEPFMHVYPGSKASATVEQSFGVSHTLGVAVQSGTTWTGGASGGSKTISLQARGSKLLTSNSTAFNTLNFRDYQNMCGWWHRQAETVNTILMRIDPAAEPNFTYCGFSSNGEYTKYRGINITFTNQVNVGPVSVNAQSGWTSSSSVTWHVRGYTGICGSNAQGWGSAPEAEANSR